MKWIVVSVMLAVTTGAVAITVGITSGSTPPASLIVTFLANISTGSAVSALVLWARETALEEVRAVSAIQRAVLRDDNSSPRIRNLRP